MASSDIRQKRPGEINEWNMSRGFFGFFADSALKKTDKPQSHMDKIAEPVDSILQTWKTLHGSALSMSEKPGLRRHAQDKVCGQDLEPRLGESSLRHACP
jgi:hypothetical protein